MGELGHPSSAWAPAECPSTFGFGSPLGADYPVLLYLGSKVTLSVSPSRLGELVASLVHQSPALEVPISFSRLETSREQAHGLMSAPPGPTKRWNSEE